MRLCASLGLGLPLFAAALQAQRSLKPHQPDSCGIIRPFTAVGGEFKGPATASAAYQGIETRWSVDTAATVAELSKFLAANPRLVGSLRAAADACPPKGCVCPKRPPRAAQTAELGQTVDLASSYRRDPEGTSAGAAAFLGKHEWLVYRVADSLGRSGTPSEIRAMNVAAEDVRRIYYADAYADDESADRKSVGEKATKKAATKSAKKP